MADMKGRKCPNCNGAVREISSGKFVCESCGTSFTTDAPQEDDELRRFRAEAEEKKRQLEAAISSRGAKKSNAGTESRSSSNAGPRTYATPGGYARPGSSGRSSGSSSRSKAIVIVIVVMIVWLIIFAVIIRGVFGLQRMAGKYGANAEKFLEQQKAEQEERIKKEQEKIEQRQKEQEERIKQQEEAARKLWE